MVNWEAASAELLTFACCRLSENLFVGTGVESDDQCPAHSQRGSSQIPGGAQHDFRQLIVTRLVQSQVEMDYFLPSHRVQFAYLADQGQRIGSLKFRLRRVHFFGGFNLGVRKKLLRFSTRLSARPVVTPVDFGHFGLLSWRWEL